MEHGNDFCIVAMYQIDQQDRIAPYEPLPALHFRIEPSSIGELRQARQRGVYFCGDRSGPPRAGFCDVSETSFKVVASVPCPSNLYADGSKVKVVRFQNPAHVVFRHMPPMF